MEQLEQAAAGAVVEERFLTDWSGLTVGQPREVLRPRSTEEVAAIATEEAHEDALREDRERAIAAVAAHSMGITPELADAQPGCRGCGACQREACAA